MNGHGYRVAHIDGRVFEYHVGDLPGRKRPALYRQDGGMLTPVAYFKDTDEAERFLYFLELLAESTRLKEPAP
jgi:hypothetical protein